MSLYIYYSLFYSFFENRFILITIDVKLSVIKVKHHSEDIYEKYLTRDDKQYGTGAVLSCNITIFRSFPVVC